MSEVQKIIDQVRAYPDDEPVGMSMSYGNNPLQLGYVAASVGDPSLKVKHFLYGVLTYCCLNFCAGVDLDLVKKEIFG